MAKLFVKGNKGGGRPKGTKNKKTAENSERINNVLSYINDKYLYEDIDSLSSSERVKTYISLMEYVVPKLARREHTGKNGEAIEIKQPVINLTISTPKELNDSDTDTK